MALDTQNFSLCTQPHQCAAETAASSTSNDDPRAELAVVEAEVAKVVVSLKTLMNKTHVLKARINQIYSSIIRLLPPEVTSEIFQACIPAFDMEELDSSSVMPLLLGSVCSSWRRIAWATPSLWASLSLRLNTSTINTQISLMDEWLSRSGDLPLSIRLFSEEEIHWAAHTTPGTAIEVINKYAPRWRDLDLRLPTSCYKYLPSSEEHLPLLVSLNLNPPGGQGERRHKVDMSNIAQIRHLSLSCVYLISMKFQWAHITHLRLEAFYVDECLEALRQTPQLVSCNLRNIIGGDDGHTLPDGPVLLSSLQTLSIDNEKDTHISLLLDTIAIPNATQFSYSGRNLIHLPSICTLIARSSALETFVLEQMVMSNEAAFLQLFRALKYVTKFVFTTRSNFTENSPLDDDLLRLCNPTLLSPANQHECLLPRLQVLEYRGPQSFTWPTLLDTLESRQANKLYVLSDFLGGGEADVDGKEGYTRPGSISEWKSVQFNLTHCKPGDPGSEGALQRPRLQALAANGMKVGVKTTSTDAENKEYTRTFF
ncbi:hypothetical protein BDZ97DRAFT_1723931 [Flammula alnicola]|nr:hypothetical protein BDZ97DRAFT_1723931 [Flammula alnicola]